MDCSPWRLWQIRPHLYRLSARAPSFSHPMQRYLNALQKYNFFPELPNFMVKNLYNYSIKREKTKNFFSFLRLFGSKRHPSGCRAAERENKFPNFVRLPVAFRRMSAFKATNEAVKDHL